MPLLSAKGYARHRGVSDVAVLKAIQTGRITRRKDGRIDSARADKQWAENTDVSKPLNSVTGDPKHLRADDDPPIPLNGAANGAHGYVAARTVRETYLAKTAKLDYERALGKMIDADDVRSAAFKAARTARDVLQNLPARVAPMVVGMDEPAIFDALTAAIREACEEISRLSVQAGKK